MSTVTSNGKGVWRQVAVVIDGKNVPFGPGYKVILTAEEGNYTVTVNGKVYQKGTAKHDYDKTPPQSDVTVTEGPQAGETSRQIFKYEGDVLIACNAPPGAARPTEFTSQPGSGHILRVWLRTATSPPPGPLTWRTWTSVAALVVFASLVGSVSSDLESSLGRWAGILGGSLAGVCMFTAIFLLLKRTWQEALALGIGAAVASSTFEGLRATLTPTLGALGTIFVSGSTAIVAASIVWLGISRLMKLHL
jgi:uncharacterized protein (TIGR03067 family)